MRRDVMLHDFRKTNPRDASFRSFFGVPFRIRFRSLWRSILRLIFGPVRGPSWTPENDLKMDRDPDVVHRGRGGANAVCDEDAPLRAETKRSSCTLSSRALKRTKKDILRMASRQLQLAAQAPNASFRNLNVLESRFPSTSNPLNSERIVAACCIRSQVFLARKIKPLP